jgi:hypothetical protein
MKEVGKVNVLDVPYTIYLYYDEFKKLNEDAQERDNRYNVKKDDDRNLDGYCDYMAKEIRIFDDKFTSKEYFEMTLRHELTHAFLYEIGNTNCDNEEFVDKISKWVPQISKIANQGLEMIDSVRNQEGFGSKEDNQ